MTFPRKSRVKSSPYEAICGELESISLPHEQRALITRIVEGLFLDMQDRPLTDIMTACFITGAHMAKQIK